MAGSVSDFSLPNSSFFNIYNDGGPVARNSPAPALPGGQCNFVDLTHGNGRKCGCRRFWSRGASGQNSPSGFLSHQEDQYAWCMCAHHACFHDEGRDGPGPVVATAPITTAGQENERPKANRDPLTPVIPDLSFHMLPPEVPSADFQTFNDVAFSTDFHQEVDAPQSENQTPAREQSLPDTLSWTNFIQSSTGRQPSPLPPILSQCLPASQPSSTTSSARMAYLKPFSGKGLQTLSCVKSKLREPLLENTEDVQPLDDDSAEPAADPAADDLQTVTNTPRSIRRTDTTERQTQTSFIGPDLGEFQILSRTVQGHEERLNSLENVSFSANGHEECHEQHDQSDLRITELEVRMSEVEKMLNDGGSVGSRRPGVDESAASVVSVSTDSSSQVDRAELYKELQALKAQLSQLQGLSSFPSYARPARPWEVVVVFLPFPLQGVWMESTEFSSQRLSGSFSTDTDQWTQLPNISSTLEPQSPGDGEWTGPEMESDWLFPRACPPDRVVDKRLRSRGLVKTVAVPGPDARTVQQAISAAFGTLFRTMSRMQANVHHGSTSHHRINRYLGLQQPWVPLRKIHKDSRLRFLSPAEMITPATWDVPFLSSSVVMKSTGVQRLYITQSEAYLQNLDAYDNAWNWQRLRELSRVYPDSQSSQQDVPEADALEDCWAWNDKLDENWSSQSSFSSLSLRQAAQPRLKSMSMSPMQQNLMRPSPSLSASRSRAQSPQVVLKERKECGPPHLRTKSMSPAIHPLASPSQAKRRVSSGVFANVHPRPYAYDRRSSPQLVRVNSSMAHAVALSKRRRNTRSPSVPMSARLRNTPRWSTRSPSPMVVDAFVPGPVGNPVGGARQTTPLFYATPHSNAPFADARPNHWAAEPEDDDRGSGTDSYDGGAEAELGSDDDSDYEGDNAMLDLGHPRRRHEDTDNEPDNQHQPPEDQVLTSLEDTENIDPEVWALDSSEKIHVYVDEDAMSDIHIDDGTLESLSQSSVPSEYPSTQRAWAKDGVQAFTVFEAGQDKATH